MLPSNQAPPTYGSSPANVKEIKATVNQQQHDDQHDVAIVLFQPAHSSSILLLTGQETSLCQQSRSSQFQLLYFLNITICTGQWTNTQVTRLQKSSLLGTCVYRYFLSFEAERFLCAQSGPVGTW